MKLPWQLHLIALVVVSFCLTAEAAYLFYGVRTNIPEVLVGRILGTIDASLLMVLSFYFVASMPQGRASQRSDDSQPPKGTTP